MKVKYDPRLDSHPSLSDSIEFRYSGQAPRRGLDAMCQVRIFRPAGKPAVVVMTEMPDNPGMSVTNAVELIASDIRTAFDLAANTIWIEHYTDRRVGEDDPTLEENFSVVTLHEDIAGLSRPEWKYLTREDFFRLLEEGGQVFKPVPTEPVDPLDAVMGEDE